MGRRRIKVVAFVALALSFVLLQFSRTEAALINCVGTLMIADYYGEEVNCTSAQAYCQATCEYCFHTSCNGVLACTTGVNVVSHCNN